MESLSNPIKNVTMPQMPPGRDRRLEENEESLLLTAPYPLQPIIVIALETAMRLGEIMNITWENIDLKKATLTIPTSKNGQRRTIPLSSKVLTLFKSLPRSTTGEVFPGNSAKKISKRFSRLCKNLGITGLRFHDLRHES